MTPLQFSVVFGLGVVSSLHCVQMCGPIVLAYSLPLGPKRGLWAHLYYNLGRITTYSFLGALAGAAGGGLGLVGKLAGVANGARIVAGIAMIVAGVIVSGLIPSSSLVTIERPGVLRRIGRLIRSGSVRSKYKLGLMLGFMPCGLIYAALLKAVDAGTALEGAATMLAFGLGTSLALVGAGAASSALGLRLGPWSNRLAAASIALLGFYLVWRGFTPAPVIACHGHS